MQAEPLAVDLTFAEAAKQWITRREMGGDVPTAPRYISPRRIKDLRRYAGAAGKFLGRLQLKDIHLGHLYEYQRARAECDQEAAAFAAPAGANVIRKEIQTIVSVLDAAGLWPDELERRFRRVQAAESDVPPAITPEEQKRLLEAAASREQWRPVYWYALLALQTTAATNELRGLRLDDTTSNTIRVRGKNHYRNRTIPVVTDEARGALENLVSRARQLGAKNGEDFLFPRHLTADRYDAGRPMTVWGLRKRWEAVREAAALPGLTIYGLRHAALTRMAEAGAPIHVMMSFAGQMSMRMQRHYVAISLASKCEWARTVWEEPDNKLPPPKKGPGRITSLPRTDEVNGSGKFFLTKRREA
jgi:integrase